MPQSNPSAFKTAKIFEDYCRSKNYQINISEETNNLRIDISNFSERTIVKIYHSTNTIQLQGKQNSLKAEMEALKDKFEANPQAYLGSEGKVEIKACIARYDIMLPELRMKIKESLGTLE